MELRMNFKLNTEFSLLKLKMKNTCSNCSVGALSKEKTNKKNILSRPFYESHKLFLYCIHLYCFCLQMVEIIKNCSSCFTRRYKQKQFQSSGILQDLILKLRYNKIEWTVKFVVFLFAPQVYYIITHPSRMRHPTLN